MLSTLIRNYRDGLDAFNAATVTDEESDALAAVTYLPPMNALRAFDGPALSHDEALQALDLAERDLAAGDVETAEALIRAARLYLREVGHG
jgi:hypothetical protein